MIKPKLTLRWLSLGAIAICASLLVNAGLTYYNLLRLDGEQQSVAEAVEIKRQLAAVLGTVVDAEVAGRGYVLSGDKASLDAYATVKSRKDTLLAELRTLVHDDPVRLERWSRLKHAVDERLALIETVMAVAEKQGTDEAIKVVITGRGVRLMDNVRAAIAEVEGREVVTLADTTKRAARELFTTTSGLLTLTLVSGGLLVLVAFLAREIRVRERTTETVFDMANMLRLVIDTIPQRIFWKDVDMRYLGCNRLFAEDAGQRSADEIVGKTDAELYRADAAARFSAADERVLRDGVSLLDYEEAIESGGRQI